MIEGAVVLLVGVAIGAAADRLLRRHQQGEQRTLESPKGPICSCGHASSFHDSKGCHERVRLKDWAGYWNWHTCTCRRYDGPEPLPEFYAPEITP